MITTRPRLQAMTGTILLVAMVLAITLIYKTFLGDFGDSISVSAEVGQAGDSLDKGDIVTYREVIVGQVVSYQATATGGARLRLRITGEKAKEVPADVTAIAVPASLFGSTKIVLIPSKNLGGARLTDNVQIPADRSPSSDGLQTALSQVYDLLTAVRPAELDSALTALASALDGQGDDVGRLLDQAAKYLNTIAPAIPRLGATIRSLATVTQDIARNSPALLDALSNALTPIAAIVRQQANVRELLGIAPTVTDHAARLLDRVDDDLVTVVTNARPVLQAINDNPDALGRTVVGFRNVGDALNSIIHHGRPRLNVTIAGANTSALLGLLAGTPTNVADSSADPPGYTGADCPRYPGSSGPNCVSASTDGERAVVLRAGQKYIGRVGAAGSAEEQQVVRTILSRLSGVDATELASVGDLIVGPLLRGTAVLLK